MSSTAAVRITPIAALRSRAPEKLYSSIKIESGREPALYSSTGVLMSYSADRNVIRPTVTAVGALTRRTPFQYIRDHAPPHPRPARPTSRPHRSRDGLRNHTHNRAARQ